VSKMQLAIEAAPPGSWRSLVPDAN
jgi:hypothetical protein